MLRNPYYQGPASDHFDGVRFYNPGFAPSDKSPLDLLKWKLFGRRSPWPATVQVKDGVRPPARVDGLQITHIGHASFLIQVNGLNLLVDPVWSERASPSTWIGPRRHNPPAVALGDLPPIHAILVTHNHYDHLDTATLRRIHEAHRPLIYAPLGNDAIIRRGSAEMQVETGDWWSSFTLPQDIRINIVPSYHWSARGTRDRRMALWGGFVLETPAGVIYCAGDTAYRDGAVFKEIGKRFEAPVVAILPIGAYAPRWFMKTQHADPDEAVRIAQECGAKHMLGVHWGTFALTDEPWHEPADQLQRAVETGSLDEARFHALRPGDIWQLPAGQPVSSA